MGASADEDTLNHHVGQGNHKRFQRLQSGRSVQGKCESKQFLAASVSQKAKRAVNELSILCFSGQSVSLGNTRRLPMQRPLTAGQAHGLKCLVQGICWLKGLCHLQDVMHSL